MGIVPHGNLHRGKRGFTVPIGCWNRREVRDFPADHLLSPRFTQRRLFRAGAVVYLVSSRHSGWTAHCAHHLWTLLMLELWPRAFIDS